MIKSLHFLSEGGEMGELIRSFDWSKTTVGSPDTWPQSLRFAVDIMLDSPFGMYIAWGKEYIQMYNDGYRPILGATKHPQALGISTRETFAEVWTTVGPMFDGVMKGTPVGFPDFILHLDRNGFVEECFFDFSYSPIRLENGEVGGVLVTVVETTEKVNNLKRLAESKDQLNFAIEAAELGTWDLNPLTNKLTVNDRLKDWFGLPMEGNVDFSVVMSVIIERDRSRVEDTIQKALQYEFGGLYDIEYGITNPLTKQERIVRAKGRAWFGEDKSAYRFNGILQDISDQVIAHQKIEASEKRFSSVLSQSIMAVGILEGEDMIISFANDSLLSMWGKEKNVIGKPLIEMLPEIQGQGFPELLAEVYKTGVPYEAFGAKAVMMHDGIPVDVYFNFVYQPYKDIENNISGITIFANEVTGQVLAKKQIEASEERFSKMVLQSPFAFAILKGKDMVISLANDAIKEIWGKGNEVEGQPLFDLLPELKQYVFPKLLEDVYTTGIPHLENEILAKLEHNGVLKDMYFNQVYQPFHDADDSILGVTVIAVEVTNQVLAKKQMEESENQFRNFADSIQNLAWIANSEGWRYWYNQQWYDYTGSTKEEMVGWGWEKVHHPDNIKNVIPFIKEAFKKDEAFELTFPLRRHDGEYHWFLTRVYPVKDTKGNIERWIGTNTDINDQIITEQKKDEFIGIASHEMKTPLTTAKGYIELLRLSLSEENQAALYATKASQAVERLHNLVTELLDASKIQNGQLNYTITTFDFNNMIDETIENFQYSAKKHLIQNSGKFSRQIAGDRERLQQVLINLLSNAVKYSPNADKVLVEVKELGNKIQLSVQDFGVGIPGKHLDKIFDRYYRVQENAIHFQGLGIGLYISYNIILRHNGTMWAESEVGKGSTFHFTLPV